MSTLQFVSIMFGIWAILLAVGPKDDEHPDAETVAALLLGAATAVTSVWAVLA